jgi:hypothetical protein
MKSTVLIAGSLKSRNSSKRRVFAATDALSYTQTLFLIQNKSEKETACQDPEGVRFQDCRLYWSAALSRSFSQSEALPPPMVHKDFTGEFRQAEQPLAGISV